jgi:hypothetical protein
MSADPNESGNFEEFFQSAEQRAEADGPAKAKPEPTEPEDWGAPPLTAETRARQARLRRLVALIVAPLAAACVLILAKQPWRAPAVEPSAPASLGVSVDSARPTPLPERTSAVTPALTEPEAPASPRPAAVPVQSAASVTPTLSPSPVVARRKLPSKLVVAPPRKVALESPTPAVDVAPTNSTPSSSNASFPLQ